MFTLEERFFHHHLYLIGGSIYAFVLFTYVIIDFIVILLNVYLTRRTAYKYFFKVGPRDLKEALVKNLIIFFSNIVRCYQDYFTAIKIL